MHKKVKTNEVFAAYLISNENDLDTFLAEEVRDFDSIRHSGKKYGISFGGTKLFSFSLGDWLVVDSEKRISVCSPEDFEEKFYLTET